MLLPATHWFCELKQPPVHVPPVQRPPLQVAPFVHCLHVVPKAPHASTVVPPSVQTPFVFTQPAQLVSRQVPELHVWLPTHAPHAAPPMPQPWLFCAVVETQTPFELQQPLHVAAQLPPSAPFPPPEPPPLPPPFPKFVHNPSVHTWLKLHAEHVPPLMPHCWPEFPG